MRLKNCFCQCALILLGSTQWPCATAGEQKVAGPIKVFRVGSSSFGYALIEDTQAIVESRGDFRLICDEKQDKAGYTRLDRFVTQPGLCEEWCEETLPRSECRLVRHWRDRKHRDGL